MASIFDYQMDAEAEALRQKFGDSPKAIPINAVERREKAAEQRAEAEKIKEQIRQQIREGTEPQYILYKALRAVGLLTNDEAWTDEQTAALDGVYGDLRQLSLIADNNQIAADRLKAAQMEQSDRLRAELEKSLRRVERIHKAIKEGLQILEAGEDPAEGTAQS